MNKSIKLPFSIVLSVISIIVLDVAFTLIGQPREYWSSPNLVSEGSPLGVATLAISPLAFIFFMSLYIVFWGFILKKSPLWISIPIGFALILGHVWGSSSWIPLFCYKLFGTYKGFISWYLTLAYLIVLSLILGINTFFAILKLSHTSKEIL